MVSISASMATLAFNRTFQKHVNEYIEATFYFQDFDIEEEKRYSETLTKCLEKGAMFDARCFNIPKEEVTNCLLWRQQDATRNSIQMVAQANFPHKQLQNKNCNELQDMLFTQKDINWNDLPTYLKRGSCCVKDAENFWTIDLDIPKFVNKDR